MNKQTLLKALAIAFISLLACTNAATAQEEENDTLLVLGGTGNPPFEFMKDDEPTGFNVELFHRLMRKLGHPYKIELRPWNEAYRAVMEGKADLLMGLAYSARRADDFKFGRATAFINLRWIVLKSSEFYEETDLEDRRIACRNRGFANLQLLQNKDDYRVYPVESNEVAFDMLFKGKVDAVLCDEIIARWIASNKDEFRGNIRILNSHFTNSEYRMAGYRMNNKIIDELEAALNELQNNGQYNELYTRWFNPEVEANSKYETSLIVASILAVIIVIGLLVIWIFNRKLHSTTRHIRTLNNRLNNKVKELEKKNDQLTHAQVKANAGARAMETLFSTVTHELRTPMNSIQGFTQLLADENLSIEERQYMEMQVKKSTKELTDLINSMIQLAELEAGVVNIRREFFCVNDAIDDVYHLYRSLNDKPEVQIIKEVPQVKVWAELDKKLTIETIEHFMSNAMKFTEKGYVKVGFRVVEGGLQFIVEDTGIGMSKEMLRNIFKKFHQKDEYTPGLGLGMHLATSIIKNSNGHIETVSRPNEGTAFKTFVPCRIIEEGGDILQ